MKIQRYQGRNLRDALMRAHRDYGDEAVVVSQEQAPSGGVTIAVAPPSRAAKRTAKPAVPGESARAMRRQGAERGLREVERRMRASGASRELITRVLRNVAQSGARGAYAIDVAAKALGKSFSAAKSPKRDGVAPVVAFVGPTGVGKTTTIAKLGTQLVMKGRRVAFVTLDTYRVGAVDQIQTYADLLESPLEVAQSVEEVVEAAQTYKEYDAVLLDTTGRSPHDVKSVEAMAELVGAVGANSPMWTYLALSAASGVGALDEAQRAFACCNPRAAILTKLDETRAPMPALEFTRFAALDVAFLCDGQDVSKHIHRPRPDHFADLALRGRIA